MSGYPVLLCPVASIPAFRHGERAWIVEGRTVEYLDAVRHTQWFNALAAPAAVVPVGRTDRRWWVRIADRRADCCAALSG